MKKTLFTFIGFIFLAFSFSDVFAQPSNDQCGSATPLTVGAACTSGSNVGATTTGETAPSCISLDGGVWFSFVAPVATSITISTDHPGNGFDTQLALYSGSCGSLTQEACASGSILANAILTVSNTCQVLVPGNTYYILLDGYAGDAGTYCINVTATGTSTNDECACATTLPLDGSCLNNQTNVGAADNWTSTIGCQTGNNHPDVHYTFVATTTAVTIDITAGTMAGTIETTLGVGSCGSMSTFGFNCGTSVLSTNYTGLDVGSTYYLVVSTTSANAGTFNICATAYTPPVVPGQDCPTSINLCNNDPFSVGSIPSSAGTIFGNGSQEDLNSVAGTCFGGNEVYSQWYKFTAAQTGTFEFIADPNTDANDYDFMLFDITTSGCNINSGGATLLSCNWDACPGNTGITSVASPCATVASGGAGATDCGNPGCQADAFDLTPPTLTAGRTYALMIHNYTTSTGTSADGFAFTFGSPMTSVIGPQADFAATTSCLNNDVSVNATYDTPNFTYLWQWGDGNSNSLAGAAGGNTTHAYAASGSYNITLTVTDALGCSDIYSLVVNVGSPAAPTVANQTICYGTTATITPTAPGGTYSYYDAPVGGTLLGTGNSYTTPALTANTNYYVETTLSGCTSTRTTVTVTVDPLPANPTAAGATVCDAGSATLTATAPGGAYDWYDAAAGGTLLANGASYTTPVIASTTTYYVQTTLSGCTSGRTAVTVTVSPSPTAYNVTGGGAYCAGGSGSAVGLADSDAGVNYQLQLGGVNTGAPVAGTGAAISFGNQTSAGTYTVVATVAATSCTATMTGSVVVTINPAPTAYNVTGGGAYCAGGSGSAVGLADSDAGVNYQLQLGGVNTGAPVAGTGAAISFGNQTTAGTYTVVATIAATSCTATMTGSAVITIDPAPTAYNVTGGGAYCAGGSGVAVGLDDSDAGVDYQLQIGGVNTGAPVAGTGSAISFGNQTTAGTYTVVATTTATGCTATMTGNAVITIDPAPTAYNVTGGGAYCAGGSGVAVGLDDSDAGVNYQLQLGGVNTGAPVAGTGAAISFGNQTSAGTYTVVATIAATSCTATMTGSVVITINPAPAIDTESSADPNCGMNDGTITIVASGGLAPYQFSNNGGTSFVSNGGSFTGLGNGSYQIVVQDDNGCTVNGSNITLTPAGAPAAPVAGTNATYCDGDAMVDLTAVAGSGGQIDWFSNAGLTTNIGANTTTLTPSNTVGATNYYITETVGACQSPASIVTITINAIPATPTPTNNGPVCEGDQLDLSTATVGGATYSWSGPNGFSSAAEDTTVSTSATIAMAGTYSLTVTVNGCVSAAGTTDAIVNAIPAAPVAGNNGPICIGEPLSLSTATVAGATYSWTGPNGFSSAAEDTTVSLSATAAMSGTYTLIITENGCTSVAGTTDVIINVLPTGSVAQDTTICSGGNADINFTFTGPQQFDFVYAIDGNPQAAINGLASNVFTLTTPTAGTYSIVSLSDGNGCDATNLGGTASVIVNNAPVITNASLTQSICSDGTATFTPTADIVGTTFDWTASVTSGTVTGFTAAGSGNISDVLSNTTSSSGEVTYVITPTGPAPTNCPGTSVDFVVTVNPTPTITNASTSQTICSGGTAAIIPTSDVIGSTFDWTASVTSGSVTGFTASGTGNISDILVNSGIIDGEVTYVITPTGPASTNCPGSAVDFVVTVNPVPTAAISGDATICAGGSTSLIFTLTGTGTFDVVYSDGTSTFNLNGISDGHSISVSPLDTTTYTLVSVTDNGTTCNGTVSGSAVVNVITQPVITNATLTQNVCSGQAVSITLSSNATGATFSWTSAVTTGAATGNTPVGAGNLTDVLNNGGPLTAQVTYTVIPSAAGCTGPSEDFVVTVYPTPSASITPDPAGVCTGVDLNLSGNPTGGSTIYTTHAWTGNTADLSATNIQNPVFNTASAGTYNLTYTVTDHRGCTGSDVISIVVSGSPVASITPDPAEMCAGQTLNMNGNPVGGAGGNFHTWSGSTSPLNLTNIQAPTFNTNVAGTYTIVYRVTDSNGCFGTDTIDVVVNALPVIDQSAQVITPSSCGGSDGEVNGISIIGVPAINYLWENSSPFMVGTNQNLTGQPADSYTLTVTDGNGCTSKSPAIVITDLNGPTSNIIPDTGTVCTGAPLTLDGNPSGGVGPYTFLWVGTGDPYLDDVTSQTPTFSTAISGLYKLTCIVTDDNGCTGLDTLDIWVNPKASITPGSPEGCVDVGLQLIVTITGGKQPYQSHTWTGDVAPLNSPTVQNPILNSPVSGIFNLNYTLVDDNGCTASASTSVVIYDNPTASITPNPAEVCAGVDLTLNGGPSGGAGLYIDHEWTGDIAELSSSTVVNPVFNSAASGVFNLAYIVTDNNGCKASDVIAVTVHPEASADILASPSTAVCPGEDIDLDGNPSGTMPVASHLWTGDDLYLSSLTTQNSVFNSNTSGNYFVRYTFTDNNGCVGTDTLSLTISTPPVQPNVSNDTTYCQGESIVDMTASGTGGTMTWYSDAGLTTIIGTGNTFTPSNTIGVTSYYVTETFGCEGTASVINITINATPVAPTAGVDATYCQGDAMAAMTASGSGGTYTWYTDAGLTTVAGTGASLTPNITLGLTTYYVTETTTGCEGAASAPVNITINPIPTAPLVSPDESYCDGDALNDMTATGSGTITWYSDAGLTTVIGSGSTLSPLQIVGTTTYYVNQDVLGCESAADSIEITINAAPAVPVGSDETECFGAPVPALSASGSGGTITWYSDPALTTVVTTGSPFNTGQTAVGTYTYYVTETANNCPSLSDTVTLTITPAGPAPVASSDATYCEGENVNPLTAIGAVVGATFEWYSDAALTQLVGTGNFVPPSIIGSTTYYVVEVMGTCRSGLDSVNVTINPNPNADFEFTPDNAPAPATVSFKNLGDSLSVTYNWNVAGLYTDTTSDFSYVFEEEGEYTVTQTITNQFGCVDSLSLIVIVDVTPLFEVPNVFTPNGDGKNDAFTVNIAGYDKLEVSIYNRWGGFIYEFDLTGAWDGNSVAGLEAPAGTYFYIIKAEKDGKLEQQQGYVTLIR